MNSALDVAGKQDRQPRWDGIVRLCVVLMSFALLECGGDYGGAEDPFCGNAVIDAGEVCDDGALNALANRCDASCAFVCVGACPLRVDPGATADGLGTSWDDAMNDLQNALDVQSAAGGGQVWVLGGMFDTLTSAGSALLQFPSDVDLFGGFSGAESSLVERSTSDEPTHFARISGTASEPLLSIIGASHVLIDRIIFDDQSYGPPAFTVQGSSDVVLRDIQTLIDYHGKSIEVVESDLRLEHFSWSLDYELVVRDSEVAFVAGTIKNANYGYTTLNGSLLLFQDVVSDAPLSVAEDSRALLVRSAMTQSFERTGFISSEGEVTLVGSAVLNRITGDTPVSSTSVMAFDSTFAHLHPDSAGGNIASAFAIEGDSVDVALSTFFDTRCGEHAMSERCFSQILVYDQGFVNNSLFLNEPGPYADPYYDPYREVVIGDAEVMGNCATTDASVFAPATDVLGQVLTVDHPCSDGGDAEALEAARLRLLDRSADFRAAPFYADLTRYEDPDFWKQSSVRVDACVDTGAPDPGQHWDLTCEP